MSVGALIMWPYEAGGRSRRGSPKAGTTVYTEKIFRHISNMKGVNVGGKHYNTLRYADDNALLAGNKRGLTATKINVGLLGKQFGMKININKTKAMVVRKKPNSPKINLVIDGQ